MSSTTTKSKTKTAAPADRKPKKPKVETVPEGFRVTMPIDGKPLTVTILTAAFDDWELLELLSGLDTKDPRSIASLPSLLRRALADGDTDRVMDALRSKDTGRVSIRVGVAFVMDLFKAVNPNG